MSDFAANAQWESALELLASRQQLGAGQVAVLRMTRVIEVDDVLVLVVSFALPRDIIERNRELIAGAVAQVWGRPMGLEVTIDPSQESVAPAPAAPPSNPAPMPPVPQPVSSTQQPVQPLRAEDFDPNNAIAFRYNEDDEARDIYAAAALAEATFGHIDLEPGEAPSDTTTPGGTPHTPQTSLEAQSHTPTQIQARSDSSSPTPQGGPENALPASGQSSAPEHLPSVPLEPDLIIEDPYLSKKSPITPAPEEPETIEVEVTDPTQVRIRDLGRASGASYAPSARIVYSPSSLTGQEGAPGSVEAEHAEAQDSQAPQSKAVTPVHPTAMVGSGSAPAQDDSRLNPRYTFQTYVQGKSNRLAKTAAQAVAEAPSKAYNPLFIYGGSGLGKTHLLHAIGHYARSLFPGITVKYVNSEEFVSDFIASVADGQMRNFKDRYRNVDILLVDDVQFFEGKEQTLEEFFHTFNALKIAEKQIVLTADTPANELKGFNQRLVSRFQEGLVADVQPPDLETRQAILTLKARADDIDVSEDVLEYIASRVTTNIRELEGALVRVTAFASLNKQPIDRTLAEVALKDVISNPDSAEITSALIMAQVADYFQMTLDELCGESRRKAFVHPRHVAMYLCRELTDLSLPNIGREFGGRDHTTVMSAHRKVAQQMGERRETFNEVNELTSRIKQAAMTVRP